MGKKQKSTNAVAVGVIIVAVLAIIAAFAALRARSLGIEATSPSGASIPPTAGLRPAPNFEIIMYQGQAVVGGAKIQFIQLFGQRKPVVLNFWAGLCPPCRGEMPDFQELYLERAKNKFLLLGVDIGPFVGLGSREDGKALLRELKITYPAGTTFDENTLRAYQILGMPTTFFITPDGKILKKYTGLLTRGQIDALVGELLQTSGTK